MLEDRFLKRLRKKSPEGTEGLADCYDCVLRSKPKPSDQGSCWDRAVRERRIAAVAR